MLSPGGPNLGIKGAIEGEIDILRYDCEGATVQYPKSIALPVDLNMLSEASKVEFQVDPFYFLFDVLVGDLEIIYGFRDVLTKTGINLLIESVG